MSAKDLFDAITSRDLKAVLDNMYPSYENLRALTQEEIETKQLADAADMRNETDEERFARYGDDLRARLSLEQQDEPRERGYSMIDDSSGQPKQGPL